MSDNIGQTNAEYSAEHRSVDPVSFQHVTTDANYFEENVTDGPTDAEKLDYLYEVALKVGKLVESISPAQVEQVKRMQSNPLMSKLFAGIIKG